MEQLTVGLVKSVVVGVITKVKSAIEDDDKLRQKVKHNLEIIDAQMGRMSLFLNAATEGMGDDAVKSSVRFIRRIAYDVEDCVDNLVVVGDKPIFWRRLLPSCMAPALPLDEAVEEIEQLKRRVEGSSDDAYYLFKVTSARGSKPASVMNQPLPGETAHDHDMLLAEARYAGALGDLTQLITMEDFGLQVVSVWGAGGDHGTTSIIRKTYNDQEICQNFTYRSWVKLMHPFSPHEFIRNSMAQFYMNSCTTIGLHDLSKMEATHEDLFKEFKQLVSEKRYLIVLEGLRSNMVDWVHVRKLLPDMNNGSRIIVCTQQSEIATVCLGPSYQIVELKKFSDQHSVCAFFKEPRVDEATHISLYKKRKMEAEDWMVDQPLIGRKSQMNKLRGYLAKAPLSSQQVVSVWGMAGIGKSFLVKHLYFESMCHASWRPKFEKYIWADVSYPFNLRSFSQSLLSDFYSEGDPVEECRRLLREHICLVVIDGIQSKEDWDLIHDALVSKASRSIIIVITTDESVAAHCTDYGPMLNVQCLEADAAIKFFRNEVLKKDPSSPLKNHIDVVEDLISKCGGIPRVIAGIAGLLATKRGDNWMDTVRHLNMRFMLDLKKYFELDSLESLFRWTQSMILDPPDFLKPCIFYLSIFPLYHMIRRSRLVRRWVAEGYSKERMEGYANENAESFFSRLVQLNIFQQAHQLSTTAFTDSTSVGMYRINGFIHDYILSQEMKEGIVFKLGDNFYPNTQYRERHLIIQKRWGRYRTEFESMDFSRLRSLTVFGKWESFFVSKSMKLLRVLDLEDASGVKDTDLDKMVKHLRCLKFLSVRGCLEIRHLPTSLGDLKQLQTLDVRYTSVVTLPKSLNKLQNLRYIRAGTNTNFDPYSSTRPVSCSSRFCISRRHVAGVEVPGGVGELTALHTLGVINVAASGGKAILKDLKKLTQLRKLRVSGINKKNQQEFIDAMSCNAHLESLSMQLDKDNEDCLDYISLPWWAELQSLKLYGLQEKLPSLRCNLSKLSKLDLDMDTLMKNDIELLAMLAELCILRLRVKQLNQDGKLHLIAVKYGEECFSFEKVKILEITCTTSRLHVTFGSKSMKNLELLTIDCSGAWYHLTGLNYLSELNQVFLKGTNDETIKTDLERQLDNHPNTPAVKLEELPRWS